MSARRWSIVAALPALVLLCTGISAPAAATFTQQIDPAETNVGEQVVVTLTVQNGTLNQAHLPTVDGLPVTGTRIQLQSMDDNGLSSTATVFNFALTPVRAGDFTIPAFDLRTEEGDTLHIKSMKVHVVGSGDATATNNATASPARASDGSVTATATTIQTPRGPVVMPPPGTAPPAAGENTADAGFPREKDGTLAKVFLIITPQTTDAYVGQSVPMRIDFYIRMDVYSDQNSLPTIKGSDFLMNNFMVRGHQGEGMMEGEPYERESWMTAISAPKSGDFPLGMERDTYWVKSVTANNSLDPFSGFPTRQANLAHEPINSNQLIIHVHPLPTEGRPANFTGAIGNLKVAASAQPASVAVGEPVTLRFTVSGEGNFDYVRCPTLADDPAWKTYVPQSRTEYVNESHTQGIKTFDQSIIPQKNGDLPLPAASFSYFDPTAKQYVTTPLTLPEVTVTGTPLAVAPTPAASGDDSSAVSATPQPTGLMPNREYLGSLRTNLAPPYHHVWFWYLQALLLLLPLLGTFLLLFRSRSVADDGRAARASQRRSLQQEEDAMSDAVRRNDALAFFLAARHVVQLQLGAQWNSKPEALTLAEIRQRDPLLAGTLQPLFAQADEVIYSGRVERGLDLAAWERRVRTELLQPQPASASP